MWIVAGVVLWGGVGVFALALCSAAAKDPGSPRAETGDERPSGVAAATEHSQVPAAALALDDADDLVTLSGVTAHVLQR